MISDYIVAVTLAETDIAFTVADRWINSGKELTMSAGWSCFDWLLGTRKDNELDKDKLLAMLYSFFEMALPVVNGGIYE